MGKNPAPAWLEEREESIILRLQVQPRARQDEVAGPTPEGWLKVRLAAPPVEGKANRRLLRFLAETFGMAPSRFELLSGETSRRKRVQVVGLSAAECLARLTSSG